MYENLYIVIPSLDPDEKLKKTVDGLKAVGFCKFVLVDDGSRPENRDYFPVEDQNTVLLRHRYNRGKGAALKTAFKYIMTNCPDAKCVITVDGDGQHLPHDALNCANALQNDNEIILGCRDFSGQNVPKRSRFGNNMTSLVFKLLCGMKISDTQTGLRVYPYALLPKLLEVKGERFEYETNMLLKLSNQGVTFKEEKIETVYIEENRTSHFHPIRDSLRIYRFILAYFISSGISFAADISFFYIILKVFGAFFGHWAETIATVGARIISSVINFTLNRKTVFDNHQPIKKTLSKYIVLAVCQMITSATLVSLLSLLLASQPFGSTVIKMFVDTCLFFFGFRIQRCWVFKEKGDKQVPAKPIKLTPKKVIGRSLLVIFTALIMVIITAVSGCLVICYGPSESLRNMLVISAKQASATKWIPGLFLPTETVEEIMADSQKVSTDSVTIDEFLNEDTNEWDDAIDGMKLIFLNEPRFKAYLLLVRDPKRVSVGVSSENFASATEGLRMLDLVAKYDCIAAINAGEFADAGGTGTGAHPMGLTYSGGKMVWNDGAKRTFIGFDKNNKLICRESMTRDEADRLGICDAVCFQTGNVLIEQSGDTVKLHYGNGNSGTAQRTAIGQRADGTVLLLVTDGRTAESIGATRNDVIGIMARYGAVNAAMLDGGSSAMLYYKDYFNKYPVNKDELDTYQNLGLVNRYKAFMRPRKMPTYFIVKGEQNND
ncbi:MAG: phosphodiester glycosidase family protein [Clostridia bacterium]|nr:phosphodiester glycosidase family protein [Clostridia bacterium]